MPVAHALALLDKHEPVGKASGRLPVECLGTRRNHHPDPLNPRVHQILNLQMQGRNRIAITPSQRLNGEVPMGHTGGSNHSFFGIGIHGATSIYRKHTREEMIQVNTKTGRKTPSQVITGRLPNQFRINPE
ncbi:MAG: hypothetical protein BWY82_01947 [Verrucomicrobia bacterium ADurb.Bin474]|nr:MAG: hypothetical protein BWY82_01947 [Verrucomicrobia bacterium ADurb.Bin474]